MTTGERISQTREMNSVLQKELAKAIGVDPVVLNRIEKDKRPVRGDEIKAIADFFNVTTDYLLGRENKPCSLSNTQSILLKSFDMLNNEGQNLLIKMLDSLKLSHSNQKRTPKYLQSNIGNRNILNVGNNNVYNM